MVRPSQRASTGTGEARAKLESEPRNVWIAATAKARGGSFGQSRGRDRPSANIGRRARMNAAVEARSVSAARTPLVVVPAWAASAGVAACKLESKLVRVTRKLGGASKELGDVSSDVLLAGRARRAPETTGSGSAPRLRRRWLRDGGGASGPIRTEQLAAVLRDHPSGMCADGLEALFVFRNPGATTMPQAEARGLCPAASLVFLQHGGGASAAGSPWTRGHPGGRFMCASCAYFAFLCACLTCARPVADPLVGSARWPSELHAHTQQIQHCGLNG